MATMEKLRDNRRKEQTKGRAFVVGGHQNSSGVPVNALVTETCSIHALTKTAKQDRRFHGDWQTVIFLKGPLSVQWCLTIGSFRCCRHSTRGRWLTLLALRAARPACVRLTGPDLKSHQTQTHLQLFYMLYAQLVKTRSKKEVARETIACRYGFMLEIIPTAGIKGVLQRYFLL